MANSPNLHIFGLWEETGALEETQADKGRMCKIHTDSNPGRESNRGPGAVIAVLRTVPMCHPNCGWWGDQCSFIITFTTYLDKTIAIH